MSKINGRGDREREGSDWSSQTRRAAAVERQALGLLDGIMNHAAAAATATATRERNCFAEGNVRGMGWDAREEKKR